VLIQQQSAVCDCCLLSFTLVNLQPPPPSPKTHTHTSLASSRHTGARIRTLARTFRHARPHAAAAAAAGVCWRCGRAPQWWWWYPLYLWSGSSAPPMRRPASDQLPHPPTCHKKCLLWTGEAAACLVKHNSMLPDKAGAHGCSLLRVPEYSTSGACRVCHNSLLRPKLLYTNIHTACLAAITPHNTSSRAGPHVKLLMAAHHNRLTVSTCLSSHSLQVLWRQAAARAHLASGGAAAGRDCH
jgi:hypothetical protein